MDKLISNLYSAYNQLNRKLFNDELPNVVITVQSKPPTKNSTIFGWVTRDPLWFYKDDKGPKCNKEVKSKTDNLAVLCENCNVKYVKINK